MGNYHKKVMEGEPIFVGVDMHKRMWHVTILQVEEEKWLRAFSAETTCHAIAKTSFLTLW